MTLRALIIPAFTLALALPTFARSPVGTPPTRAPSPTFAARFAPTAANGHPAPLNAQFSILNTISIFDLNRGMPPATQSSAILPPPPAPPASSVFRASLRDDIGPLAELEFPNSAGTSMLILREGQAIPGTTLKVLTITLDNLRLIPAQPSTNPRFLDVPIGRSLDGRAADALPAAPSYRSADAPNPTAPAAPATPASRFRNFRTPARSSTAPASGL